MDEKEKTSQVSSEQTAKPESTDGSGFLKKLSRNLFHSKAGRNVTRGILATTMAATVSAPLAETAMAKTMIDSSGVTSSVTDANGSILRDTLNPEDYSTIVVQQSNATDPASIGVTDIQNVPIPESTINQSSEKLNQLLRSVIGVTTDDDILKMDPILKKDVPDGKEYSFLSPLNDRPDIVVTKNGKASFEREILPLEVNSAGHALISKLEEKLGKPDQIVKGSKNYSWDASTYIYANKGVAFIGQQDTVFEIQTFAPMSVNEYIQQYGQDLNPGVQAPKEGGPAPSSAVSSISPPPEPAKAPTTTQPIKEAGPDQGHQNALAFVGHLPKPTPDVGFKFDKSKGILTIVLTGPNAETDLNKILNNAGIPNVTYFGKPGQDYVIVRQ